MDLYIVRHGETDWNTEKKLQGRSDIPLNENGIKLAELTAEGIADIQFTHIYASPLQRAYVTAEILRRDREIPIQKDERIIEICFGTDEGVPVEERRADFMLFFSNPEQYEPAEGAESYEQLCARAEDFIYNELVPLSEREPDSKVMVVAHGAMNRALMITLRHESIAHMWDGVFQKNCAVNHFTVEGTKFQSIEEGKIYWE